MKKLISKIVVFLFAVSIFTVTAGAANCSPTENTGLPLTKLAELCKNGNCTDLDGLKQLCENGNCLNLESLKQLCNGGNFIPDFVFPGQDDDNDSEQNPPDGNQPEPNDPQPSDPEPSDPQPDVPEPNEPTTPDTPVDPEPSAPISDYESEVIRLVNEIRKSNGLQEFKANAALSNVARVKSQDMLDKQYFSHTSPTYGTPFDMMKTFGISYRTAGENIAYGYSTPQAVVDGWMNSEGHRANILNASYTQIGVGYVANGHYWTQMFIG